LVLVIEDDSHISRLLRNHLEKAFPNIRVEIAGSPSKAKMLCEKFKPQLIIWDGQPNERGTREEYAACIPDDLWKKTVPISVDPDTQSWAQSKGAHPPIAKPNEALNAWAAQLVTFTKPLLIPVKSGKRATA
jgi:DNA-binding NtrC family response regulator